MATPVTVVLVSLLIQGCFAVDSLRFLVLGDWGGLPTWPYTTLVETSVAKQMADVSATYGTKFNLALGDNFYYDGVTDVDDKRFEETFENVYKSESLMNDWFFVAGNHDHYGNVSAQIAYSQRSKRWNFPNYYYKLAYPVAGNSNLDIIMIDTVLLCGNTNPDWEHDQPKSPVDLGASDEQLDWIEKQLQTSTADYLIVAGHFPVYSIAEHGPTDCLVKRLKPLLLKYKVTAYMNGHDHNLQHIRANEDNQEFNYFTTGAANFVDSSEAHKDQVPDDWILFHWARIEELGGFTYVEATPNNMTFVFVDGLKKYLYEYVLFPRKI